MERLPAQGLPQPLPGPGYGHEQAQGERVRQQVELLNLDQWGSHYVQLLEDSQTHIHLTLPAPTTSWPWVWT